MCKSNKLGYVSKLGDTLVKLTTNIYPTTKSKTNEIHF